MEIGIVRTRIAVDVRIKERKKARKQERQKERKQESKKEKTRKRKDVCACNRVLYSSLYKMIINTDYI